MPFGSGGGGGFTGGTIGDLEVDGHLRIVAQNALAAPLEIVTAAGSAASDYVAYLGGKAAEFAVVAFQNDGRFAVFNAAGQELFRVAADGSLQGRTGKALVFNL